jgi:hypothetical protein
MWDYRAALIKVTDGDTMVFLVDTGFHGRQEVELRLAGVNAPELSQPGGIETKTFVSEWLQNSSSLLSLPPMRWPLRVQTQINTNPEPIERRSFTRYIGWVHSFATGASLNTAIIDFLNQHPEWGPGS